MADNPIKRIFQLDESPGLEDDDLLISYSAGLAKEEKSLFSSMVTTIREKLSAFFARNYDSIADLPPVVVGRTISTNSYHPGGNVGGIGKGVGVAAARHDGVINFDPNRAFPTDWNDAGQLTAWYADSGVDAACWVRVGVSVELPLSMAGAVDGGAVSDYINAVVNAGIEKIAIDLKSGDFDKEIPIFDGVIVKGLGEGVSVFTRSLATPLFSNFGTRSELHDLQISGGSSAIIVMKTGSTRQYLNRCRLIAVNSSALQFEPDGGQGLIAENCIFGSSEVQTAGVNMPTGVDTTGMVRHFSDCGGAGNPLIDLKGMNDTFCIGGFSTNGIRFGDDTSKAFISNMRWGASTSNPSTRVEIRGENIIINDIVGQRLDLYCSSSRISSITPDYDIVDYGAGNMVSVRGRLYTPALTGSGGVQPDIGSGSIEGFYSREGNLVTVTVEVVFAADSTVGDGRFRIGLPTEMPVVQNLGLQQFGGNGQVRATPNMMISARFFQGTRYFELLGIDTAGVRTDVGVGFTFAAGDRIWIHTEYYV